MKFSHISPLSFGQQAVQSSSIHLTLAHLIDELGENYTNQFQDGKDIIMDNSAFEFYKAGKPMLSPNKLIGYANQVNADYVVMTDYPGESGQKTIDAANKLGSLLKDAGFKTFFVPQSKIRDYHDYINTFKWALNQDWIDLIGVSILGVPNAYGVESDNNLQRYLSRYKLLHDLTEDGILQRTSKFKNKLHFLGMTDGPNEIDLVADFDFFINSWDTSAAVWAGMNNIQFDDSPTGLLHGKFAKEVDFLSEKLDHSNVVTSNIKFINDKNIII